MNKLEFLKEALAHRTKLADDAIKKMLDVRNELQEEIDKRAVLTFKHKESQPLFVKNLVSNEPVSQVIVIGNSKPELDVDAQIYPYGVVDVKDVELIESDDYLTVGAERICTRTESGEYVPVITKPFI